MSLLGQDSPGLRSFTDGWRLPAVMAVLAAGLSASRYWKPTGLSDYYFAKQDLPLACAMIAAAVVLPLLRGGGRWENEVRLSPRTALVGIVLLVAVGTAGHWLVMFGYDLSRDQAVATFAAEQIVRGTLVTPIPSEWQPFARAMMPLYYHWAFRPELAVASGYLPINSAFQALGDLIAHRSIANPVLLVVGLLALWQVARRMWPGRRDAAVVAVLLGATSAQLLVNAMTSYAMVGHFALNMVWLALFLRQDFLGAVGALIVGFLAMGLHQFHFHPMFAAPFLLWLGWRRRWSLTVLYALGYAVILLVWTRVYPEWLFEVSGAAAGNGTAAGAAPGVAAAPASTLRDVDLAGYIAGRVGRLFEYSPRIWVFNLVRFFTWQNISLIPLAGMALPILWSRERNRAGPLLPIITVCAIGLLLPVYQGHGFGYRYLSGAIGCFCLLAGYGWIRLVPEPGPGRAWAVLKTASGFTLMIVLPLQLLMARELVSPYARIYHAAQAAGADVVLVDTEGGFLAQDLVQNGPDFTHVPKMMDLSLVSAGDLETLCRTKRVMRIDSRHYRAAGMRQGRIPAVARERLRERRPILDRLDCAPPLPLSDLG